ncbi:MAG TPA: PAS domain S-box protein, partial [Acidobacteriota bacterium]|nr:PAS domain S-box protein [Acidobacteriota bacterium]
LRGILSAYEQLISSPMTATVRFTEDGLILDCNEVFLKTVGCDEDECNGLRFWELLAEPSEKEKLREEILDNHHLSNRRFTISVKGSEVRPVLGSFALLTTYGEQTIVQATLLDSRQLNTLSELLQS